MHSPKTISAVLWTIQALLALFFAGASGAPKLLLPPEMIPMPIALPHWFLLFIGSAEVLGALGLILPGVLHVGPRITPLAAVCLVLLTICATVYQIAGGAAASAVYPVVVGLLCAFVAYGRTRLAPLQPGRQRTRAYAT